MDGINNSRKMQQNETHNSQRDNCFIYIDPGDFVSFPFERNEKEFLPCSLCSSFLITCVCNTNIRIWIILRVRLQGSLTWVLWTVHALLKR